MKFCSGPGLGMHEEWRMVCYSRRHFAHCTTAPLCATNHELCYERNSWRTSKAPNEAADCVYWVLAAAAAANESPSLHMSW